MQKAVTWEYQKDGFTSYMITKQLEHTEEYECRMIEEDPSLCLLPCHSKEGKLWFEIQDHMTLEEGLYRTRSQGRYLREVFEKLLHVLEQFEGTLLREDSIYLSKETIFLDAKEQLSLCYLSGYEGNIREQIVRLVEYLMKKIDHKDQEAVVFVYGLYPVVQEQNFSLERVKEFLQEQAAVRMEMPQTQSVFLAEQEDITESQKRENPVKQRNEKEEKTYSPKEYVAQKKEISLSDGRDRLWNRCGSFGACCLLPDASIWEKRAVFFDGTVCAGCRDRDSGGRHDPLITQSKMK